MIPRLEIKFSLLYQWQYWFGKTYPPEDNEYLLNHARSGIVLALRSSLSDGGRVGVMAYNCDTVANAILNANCEPIFVDVTEDLHIDINSLKDKNLDAIVVSNLFGIHNDINKISALYPHLIIIVDNAHGYGLPIEGDFTVYSIDQGKFPSIGRGGVLHVNNVEYKGIVQEIFDKVPSYTFLQQFILFCKMIVNALLHLPLVYGIVTIRLKYNRKIRNSKEEVVIKRMPNGISRIYNKVFSKINALIEQRKNNAEQISLSVKNEFNDVSLLCGMNAFMLVAKLNEPNRLKKRLADKGIESATHFSNSIVWAKQFGYTEGSCPTAERLTKELLMLPTYRRI
jgi:dTDP-4-amino-4,6-dideoxygalactose transaminase